MPLVADFKSSEKSRSLVKELIDFFVGSNTEGTGVTRVGADMEFGIVFDAVDGTTVDGSGRGWGGTDEIAKGGGVGA